ncbi:nucleotide pyrophosphohydrolase [archaeon]|nr:nucleotide pyrophosphohydrolase [archaeon]
MDIREFQKLMLRIYGDRDLERGVLKTALWLVEAVGELMAAVRDGDREKMEVEFADVFAWLCSLANLVDIDLEDVSIKRYRGQCPKCGHTPCRCPFR